MSGARPVPRNRSLRVAVIGGRGFVGTRLLQRLAAAGHHPVVLDRAAPAGAGRVDVRDAAQVAQATAGADVIVNLAAVHRDDVRPRTLYDEVNVQGAASVCEAARRNGIATVVFTSSVAVYGLGRRNADESAPVRPFDDYGRTKAAAEGVYRSWQEADADRSLVIVRPTVIFGEGNRGNVYNLLAQVAARRFVMVGDGLNVKSLAYVENVAAFLVRALSSPPGTHCYNYADKPDLSVKELIELADGVLFGGPAKRLRVPYWLGYAGGLLFDVAAALTRRSFPVSAVRVRKFCAATQFAADRAVHTGFVPPFALRAALERTIRYEFVGPPAAGATWLTE